MWNLTSITLWQKIIEPKHKIKNFLKISGQQWRKKTTIMKHSYKKSTVIIIKFHNEPKEKYLQIRLQASKNEQNLNQNRPE